MRQLRLILLLGVVLSIVTIAYVWLRIDTFYVNEQMIELQTLYRAYAHFLKDNNGTLPRSLDDLVAEDYLRKNEHDGVICYRGPTPRQGEIIPVYDQNEISDLDRYIFFWGGTDAAEGKHIPQGAVLIESKRRSLREATRTLSEKVLANYSQLTGRMSLQPR